MCDLNRGLACGHEGLLREMHAVRTQTRRVTVRILPQKPSHDPWLSQEEYLRQIEAWRAEKDPFRERPGFNARVDYEIRSKLDNGGQATYPWRCSETGLCFLLEVTVDPGTSEWRLLL